MKKHFASLVSTLQKLIQNIGLPNVGGKKHQKEQSLEASVKLGDPMPALRDAQVRYANKPTSRQDVLSFAGGSGHRLGSFVKLLRAATGSQVHLPTALSMGVYVSSAPSLGMYVDRVAQTEVE